MISEVNALELWKIQESNENTSDHHKVLMQEREKRALPLPRWLRDRCILARLESVNKGGETETYKKRGRSPDNPLVLIHELGHLRTSQCFI